MIASPTPATAAWSDELPSWLAGAEVALLLAARRADRVIALRAGGDAVVAAEIRVPAPMGLARRGEELWIGSGPQLFRLEAVRAPPGSPAGAGALTWVPRRGVTVGAVGARDLQVAEGGPLFVSTLHSSIVEPAAHGGVRVVWSPPWLSEVAPDDRSRLGGFALDSGRPRYAAALARSDLPGGWRHGWLGGGVVVDVESGEALCSGLCLPCCPRLDADGRLWVLQAGTGEIGIVEDGRFRPVAALPGVPRHLLMLGGRHALVALSALRPGAPALPLDRRLRAASGAGMCGVAVIDLRAGEVAAWVSVEVPGGELDAVAAVPAESELGPLQGEAARRLVTFPEGGTRRTHWLTSLGPLPAGAESRSPGLPAGRQLTQGDPPRETAVDAAERPGARAAAAAPSYAFHPVPDASLGRLAADYEGLTFPDLALRNSIRALHEPLVAVAALVAGSPVGLAVAERRPGHPMDLVSLRVHPHHRRRGVGGELLHRLEVEAARAGATDIQGTFRSGWSSRPAIERLIAGAGWSAPQPSLHLFRIARERSNADALPEPPALPAGCEIFPWSELRADEREGILARQAEARWYPDVLTPFQEAPRLEPRVSLGLRQGGEVAGWIIAHRVSDDTLQYSTLFVSPELQRLGVGLALMVEARRRRMATDYEFAIFAVDPRNRRMLELVASRLAPVVVGTNQMLVSGKRLA